MNRPSPRLKMCAFVVALAAIGAGCNDDATGNGNDNGTGNGSRDTIVPDADDPFGWVDFGDDDRVQTGSLEVPIDYADPSKGTFDLFVARHLAEPSQRIGSLLVNPGGPGFGGSDFAVYAEQVYGEALLERFDIVGWDPRGTGLSEPAVDCTDDYDRFYAGLDITPDDAAERQAVVDTAKEFADACVAANGEFIQYVGTNNSARDMDSIRAALGEATISYFGFSYGSELGATWATLFPDTVRAAVLDGAADPTADFVESGLQQAVGFESTLTTFLQQCSADASCAFHHDGDAEGAFDALMLALDEQPVPSIEGRPDVNRQVAVTAVSQAMYSDQTWPQLAQALADAEAGDGAGLLELYDMYYDRSPDGTYSDALEAFQTIVCMDDSERLTVEQDDAYVPQYQAAAPRLAPGTTGSYFCTFFPASTDPRVPATGAGAGPILVMGTTGDSATPLAGTRVMADTLEDGRLVVVTADQHTGYSVNACSAETIERYLIDPVGAAPVDGTECT
ncbi:MAG: alpha/beta fold hydrolase [Actinomycetota bacterium]|nr:alpha/beta fold hydrolase [Actinomycetota bacterium]